MKWVIWHSIDLYVGVLFLVCTTVMVTSNLVNLLHIKILNQPTLMMLYLTIHYFSDYVSKSLPSSFFVKSTSKIHVVSLLRVCLVVYFCKIIEFGTRDLLVNNIFVQVFFLVVLGMTSGVLINSY